MKAWRILGLSLSLGLFGACNSSSNKQNDAVPSCQSSVADWCAQSMCLMDWPAEPTTFCENQYGLGGVAIAESCGRYHVFLSRGVDISYYYYYEATNGKLVAIVVLNANEMTRTCGAGPAGFIEPDCANALIGMNCGSAGKRNMDGGDSGPNESTGGHGGSG
jgi:hypothetical protein